MTANAEEVAIQFETKDVIPASCAKLVYDEHKVLYMTTTDDETAYGANYYDDKMFESSTFVTYNGAFSGTSATVTSGYKAATSKQHRGTTVLFHSVINVPAGATYRVTYSASGSMVKSKDDGMGFCAVIGYLGEDDSELHSCAYTKYGAPILNDNIASASAGTKATSLKIDLTTKEVVYTNTDSKAKDFISYFVFASGARAGASSSGVTASSTLSMVVTSVTEEYINAPENLSTDYDGQNHWVNSFSDEWIKNYHSDENAVTLNSINYVPPIGSTTGETASLGTDTSNIKNAGTYTVNMGLASGLNRRWSDGATSNKTFTITIDRVTPTVNPVFSGARPFVTGGFPQPESYTATYNGTDVAGKFEWVNQTSYIEVNKSKEYEWTFKPDDDVNYKSVTGKLTLNFQERKVQSKTYGWKPEYTQIFTKTSIGELMDMITLEVKYNDSDTPVNEMSFNIESAHLVADGESYLMVSFGGGAPEKFVIPSTVEVIEAAVESLTVMFKQNGAVITVETPLDDLKQYLTVWVKWNYNEDQIKIEDSSAYELSGTLAVNGSGIVVEYEGISEPVTGITVTKATYNMNGVALTGDLNPVYNGNPHALTLTGTLPNGVTAGDITYTKDGVSSTTAPTDAGTYAVKVSFTGDSTNYNAITDKTATLKIDKATVTGIVFEGDVKPEITGKTYTLEATGVPSWVTVQYYYKGALFTGASAAGDYEITAKFTHTNPNYEQIDDITKTLTITDKPDVAGAKDIVVEATISETYTGKPVDYAAKKVPAGVTVSYEILKDGVDFDDTEIIEVGTYTITVKFDTGAAFAPIADKTCVVTISKADFDIENYVTFSGKTVPYNGDEFTLAITQKDGVELPDWITVSYEVEGQDGTSFSAVGTYNFVAKFAHDNGNYEPIGDMSATLKITTAALTLDVTFDGDTVTYDGDTHGLEIAGTLPAWVEKVTYYVGESEFTGAVDAGTYVVTAKFTVDTTLYEQPEDMTATLEIEAAEFVLTGVTFENGTFVYDGEAHGIYVGGAELPEWITVSYTGNEVSEIGTHTVVAKFEHTNGNYQAIADMTAQIVISKAKIALPVYKGTLSYSGDEIKPTAADFDGYNADLMTFVTDKTVAGLNAGAYKAVFALIDSDRYEWATATTLKKALFAVVYDEVVLEDYEAAVEWNIARAKISATKANGKLPVFASESYTGSLADIVGLKYYTDETCTEEISADELAYSTKYYVKAELLDGSNFELDETAVAFAKNAFEYTTPEKQLTVWEKIVKFVVTNWLWIVIAVAALILFITIIALIARAAKKKRIREERRLAEEKAERERREEREEQRRREDREERMARLSQQQAMPQMMMPQMMPQMPMQQSMPQAAQPMAAGGGSSNEIAELKAEMAAMKASQDMAKELAIRAEMAAREMALRAEQNAVMRSDINALRGGEQTSGIIGISIDKLTELVEKTVERVLGKEKPATAAPEAAPAATQVPPDAVMTTVTTTKIDTTKKPAQTAQAAPAGRTVVRNVVAPMPVDDGRVFDVGGFYKPADPITDMDNLLGDDENKD